VRTILDAYEATFELTKQVATRVGGFLEDWKGEVPQEKRPVDLIRLYYELLEQLQVRHWELDDRNINRLGTLARVSTLLADYEAVRRRARPDDTTPGEQVGGQDRGTWYYRHLGIHIVNYAVNAYGDFDGEPDVGLDAVDLLTVHGAKGLEWPAVFVPSMTGGRFPSRKNGTEQQWPLSRDLFDAARYEGSDADERRLFYVAMTRARAWLSASHHTYVRDGSGARPQRQPKSPYLATLEIQGAYVHDLVAREHRRIAVAVDHATTRVWQRHRTGSQLPRMVCECDSSSRRPGGSVFAARCVSDEGGVSPSVRTSRADFWDNCRFRGFMWWLPRAVAG